MAASLILAENYLTDPNQRPAVQQAVRWLSAQALAKVTAHHDRLRHGTAPPSWALTTSSPASPAPAGSCSLPSQAATTTPNQG